MVVALGLAVPGEAQREYEPLVDKFNFKFEGSWIGLKTEIRLDSETLDHRSLPSARSSPGQPNGVRSNGV